MTDVIATFTDRLYGEWLPEFCYSPHRNHSVEGFKDQSISKLSAFDAYWFLCAVDSGMVESKNGFLTAPLSKAKEQIFWTGRKTKSPRSITLWVEPVITIGALARLHNEFGWPIEKLGMQSQTWAFDLVGYGNSQNDEIMVCEVKKESKEIDTLLHHMKSYCDKLPLEIELTDSREKNAYRKVQGIRRSWPRIFWALGPNGKGEIFKISKTSELLSFSLDVVKENSLRYKSGYG